MFLKSLKIENNGFVIRDIPFHKGINLIVDETRTKDKKESGNNVGKTTVLRLIDYCLGGKGQNIYQDTEFKQKSNTQIEQFLKNNNIIITLVLKDDIEVEDSKEISIRRNFLNYSDKIQEINGEKYNDADFLKKLKELIFKSGLDKPTIRQIIAKNIRDEKNRLVNTIKVLDPHATQDVYEPLYLFWLGIELDENDRKQRLLRDKGIEENLQKRLKKENSLSQINQSLLVIERSIKILEIQKDSFDLNEDFNEDIQKLNQTKFEINKISTEFSRLELRKELINESKTDLERDYSQIDISQIKRIYEEAKVLVPNLQKTFEDTLNFHNSMVTEKIKFITQELPSLDTSLGNLRKNLDTLLGQEKHITEELRKNNTLDGLQHIISELNKAYEKKGRFDELKSIWENSIEKLGTINSDLEKINKGITSKDDLIQERISEFNKYFSDISNRLYGELFVLSSDRNAKGYELNISSISGNLGTGKKKGQIAAFDLAYIQFADALNIECLHFILHDQIENVHDNQISSLLTEIVSNINCQYVLPVLRDKLPADIDISQYETLSLSQTDKLFRI